MSAILPIFPDRFVSLIAARARPIACPRCDRDASLATVALATACILSFISVAGAMPAQAASLAIDLTQQPSGSPPKDFQFWRGGKDDPGHWRVVRDPTAAGGVLIKEANPDKTAPSALAIYDPLSMTNATIRVHFKLVDGSMPSAGIALRVTGPDNYDLVRASAFEERLSFIHVVGGASEEIASVDGRDRAAPLADARSDRNRRPLHNLAGRQMGSYRFRPKHCVQGASSRSGPERTALRVSISSRSRRSRWLRTENVADVQISGSERAHRWRGYLRLSRQHLSPRRRTDGDDTGASHQDRG